MEKYYCKDIIKFNLKLREDDIFPREYPYVYCAGIWFDYFVISDKRNRPRVILCRECDLESEKAIILEDEGEPYIHNDSLMTVADSYLIVRNDITELQKISKVYIGKHVNYVSNLIYVYSIFTCFLFLTVTSLSTLKHYNLDDERVKICGSVIQDNIEYLIYCGNRVIKKYDTNKETVVAQFSVNANIKHIYVSDKIFVFCDKKVIIYILSLNLKREYLLNTELRVYVRSAYKLGNTLMFGFNRLFSIDLSSLYPDFESQNSDVIRLMHQRAQLTFKSAILLKVEVTEYRVCRTLIVRNISEYKGEFVVNMSTVTKSDCEDYGLKWKKYKNADKKLLTYVFSNKPFGRNTVKNLPSKCKKLIIRLILISSEIVGKKSFPIDIILYIAWLAWL